MKILKLRKQYLECIYKYIRRFIKYKYFIKQKKRVNNVLEYINNREKFIKSFIDYQELFITNEGMNRYLMTLDLILIEKRLKELYDYRKYLVLNKLIKELYQYIDNDNYISEIDIERVFNKYIESIQKIDNVLYQEEIKQRKKPRTRYL